MIKNVLRRSLSVFLAALMLVGYFPTIHLSTDGMGQTSVDVELAASPLAVTAYAADGDPLQNVATVTTGGSVSTYVDIDSTYTPAGYTTRTTGTSAYTGSPGNDFSYHTSRNGSTSNSYVITPTNDLSWSKNSGNTGVTGTLSDTAVSDYKGCGENGALCAKVNSKVIRIQALADVNVTFDFSSNLTIDKSAGQGNIMEGVYTLKTTAAAPTIAQIKAGTVRSNTTKTDLSKTVSATGSVSESLKQGEYLYIYFYGFFNNQSSNDVDTTKYTYTASVTNFEITPVTENFSLTVGNSDCGDNLVGGGNITVNGTAVSIPAAGSATGLSNALSGTSVSLSVKSVPSGYFHIGWRINGTDYFQKNYSLTLNANTTAYALVIPQVTVTMGNNGYSDATYSYQTPSGVTVNAADQYIARNSAATAYYTTLEEAFNANDVVVLLGNVVLNGDFTIPSGKTLSVQRDWTDPATADLQQLAESAGTSFFAKATINGTVTVLGSLVASGVQGTNDGVNGRATGGVGQLIVNGVVDVAAGGKVCAYGMITGPGHINVASGGTVYELMEIRDMRSVYVLPTVATGNAFPLNHYFIKTNEVETTYETGAGLIGCYYVAVSGIKSGGQISIIGTTGDSMFILRSGSLNKSFRSESPYNNKMIFRVNSGSIVETGHFSINISTTMGSYAINTSEHYLPLNYCFAVEIEDGGALTLNYDYKLLPGAMVDVEEGGTLNIASGASLVFYRANDYQFAALSGFGATRYPTSFTRPSGLSYASNTAANVGSAKLNVDGTMNVSGGLYVTNQPNENTTYPNGYHNLTGTGTINITGSLSNGSIYEYTQSAGDSASEVTVSYVPIKGLTNYDAAADDGQTDYDSLTADTWYGLINDHSVNVWSKTKPVTLSFDANGGSGKMNSVKEPAGTTVAIPESGFTAPEGREFVEWNTKADGTGTKYAPKAELTLSEDMTLYAQWSSNQTFTVTWKNGETVLETDENVASGTIPAYDGETPAKPADADYSYAFSGWSDGTNSYGPTDPLPAVTADVTYTATFSQTPQIYSFVENSWTWTGDDTNGYTAAAAEARTADGEFIKTLEAEVTSETTAATCETAGTTVYTATVTFEGTTYTDSKEVSIPATGHDWGETTYSWAADNSSVTASRICKNDATHEDGETVSANLVEEKEAACEEPGIAYYLSEPFDNPAFQQQRKNIERPATGHAWSSPSYEWAEDYSSVTATRVCENDPDHAETETVYTTAQITKPATCTAMGDTTYTASFANEAFAVQTQTVENVPMAEHTPGEAVRENEIPASCSEEGSYQEVVYCSVCGEELSRQVKITEKLAHTAGEPVVENRVEATCSEEGSYDEVVYCAVCGAELTRTTKTIEKIAHTPGEAVRENERAATCTEDGSYDEVVYCKICAVELSREGKAIEALGHDWSEWAVATEPTCTEAGKETRTCARCDETETRELEALGHDLEHHEAQAATCTEKGWEAYDTCSRCDYTTYVEIPATGHDWNEATYEWADDNGTVTATRTCKNDPSHADTETVETISEVTKAATCEEKGETTYTAEFRNEAFATQTKTVENIDALGHTSGEAVMENKVEATCTEAGSYDEVVYCTVCQQELSRVTKTVAALGHDYVATETEPTCTEQGYTTHTCSRCDDSYVDTYVDALGHDWSEWAVTTKPTCTKAGEEIRTCTRCGEKETREVEAIGHDWGAPTWKWTGVEKATATFVCKNDETHVTEIVAEGDAIAVSQGTGEDLGKTLYTATVTGPDGKIYTNTITRTRTFTVTWIVDDESSTETYEYGQTPAYKGGIPAKQGDAQYSYSFKGWTPELAPVTGDITYTAEFTQTVNEYTVTWLDDSGNTLKTTTVPYGEIPAYSEDGSVPTKAETAQYSYSFKEWTPEIVPVTGETSYQAVFTETVRIYTVTWIVDGKSTTETYEYGQTPEYKGETTKPATAQYTYTFKGWTPEIAEVTGNASYTAVYEETLNTYTITWVVDGKSTAESYQYGQTPEYKNGIPGKEGDAQYSYTFTGWTPEIQPVEGDAQYTAVFEETVNQYTIRFLDGDKVLSTQILPYGEAPAFEAPAEKEGDGVSYKYVFVGWTPELAPVTGDADYTARYEKQPICYTITWTNYDGSLLAEESVAYGQTPAYTGPVPEREGDVQYTYTFRGWTPEIKPVEGDATYTAEFDAGLNRYAITFVDEDGETVLDEQEVEYGKVPEYAGPALVKAGDAQYSYTFSRWDPAITAVTGDAIYTAVYTEETNLYTVTWNNDDGTVLDQEEGVPYGAVPEYKGETPAKEPDAQYTYTFRGWTPEITEDTIVTGNVTYTAVYEKTLRTYTVTWTDWDGTILETDEEAPYGSTPKFDGENPERARTAQYTYSFTGWTPALTEVTSDVTYTAQYTETVNQYTIRFLDEDGTVLDTQTLDYGAQPEYKGTEPTKESDAQYDYRFAGWAPEIAEVTGDAAYTARYEAKLREYTITWLNEDGTVLKTDEKVPYGTIPEYTGETPAKDSDERYDYSFKGWTPEIAEVTGDIRYTAVYESKLREYNITFVDEDGKTVLFEGRFPYGSMPVYGGEIPTKEGDAQYSYHFLGWEPELTQVSGEATYTAAYEATVNSYTVTWKDEDGTVFETDTQVPYGTKPTYDSAEPTRVGYRFGGWDPEITEETVVTGDVSYTAKWIVDFARVLGGSLSLNSDIGVNFYVTMPERLLQDGNAYVTISEIGAEERYLIAEAETRTVNGEVAYRFSRGVPAAHMNNGLTLRVYDGEGKPVTLLTIDDSDKTETGYTMSVRNYLDFVMTYNYPEKLKALAAAMRDYGSFSQAEFGYDVASRAEILGDISVVTLETVEAYKPTASISDDLGIRYYGSSLVLLTRTSLRFYFQVATGDLSDYSFTLDGKAATPVKNGSYVYVELADIGANELNRSHTVTVTDGSNTTTATSSALGYVYTTLQTQTKQTLVDLVRAVYLYYTAADDYFSSLS